jgi:8-oxo-dGTP diphosphatase
VREIREELAIEIAVDGIYDVIFYRYPERHVLVLAYSCRWLSGEIQDLEVAEHCWASPADVVKFDLLPADIPLALRIAEDFANGDTARI